MTNFEIEHVEKDYWGVVMLVKETITLDERELTHIWSDKNMLIRNVDTGELYSDVLNEDCKFEFKAVLNPNNPIKWAKTLVAFANGEGGILFVGVSDDREAFGITLDEIDLQGVKIYEWRLLPYDRCINWSL